MATLEENINQAIADFDDIEAAIEEMGVEVDEGTDTSEYGDLIRSIQKSPIKYVESDSSNPIYLRDLESGTYVLYGKFRPYNGSTSTCAFSTGMLVSVIRNTSISYIQIFYSKNNSIQYCEITDDTYTRNDAKLLNMQSIANLTTTVDENSDDEHYPSAKAVYNAMELKRIESLDTENMKYMRDIENGYYIMHGYFQPFPNSDYTVIMDTMCVSVVRVDEGSHLMAFSPLNFKIRCYEILVDDTAENGFVFNSWVINLLELQGLIEKVGNLEERETANALKANASGEVIRVDDVSPIEHTAKISVRGRNLFDISKVPITGGSTKISVTEVGANYIVVTSESGYNSNGFCSTGVTLSQLCPQLREGDTVTLNAESPSIMDCFYLDIAEIADSATRFWHFGNGRLVTKEMLNAVVCVYGLNAIQGDGIGECTISNIQLEEGDTATEYEPYIDPATVTVTRYGVDETDNPQTYTPEADGTCEIVSLSPTMTLLTDTAGVNIEIEYNQDTNAVMDNVKADIQELDRVTSELLNGGGGGSVALDSTLTQGGTAADAKAVGDRLTIIETALSGLETLIDESGVIEYDSSF